MSDLDDLDRALLRLPTTERRRHGAGEEQGPVPARRRERSTRLGAAGAPREVRTPCP